MINCRFVGSITHWTCAAGVQRCPVEPYFGSTRFHHVVLSEFRKVCVVAARTLRTLDSGAILARACGKKVEASIILERTHVSINSAGVVPHPSVPTAGRAPHQGPRLN